MLGVVVPVAKSLRNSGFGPSRLGVESGAFLASLISALKSFFGDAVLIDTFFDGGVLPGVVGRIICGVNCFEGVLGFFTGVGWRDLGVTDCLPTIFPG